MSRALIQLAMLLVFLASLLGGTAAGQSTRTKPAAKAAAKAAAKPAAKTAPEETPPSTTPVAAADLKIRTRYTSGAQSSENTTYVKGPRQRVEFPGAITIEQGDVGRSLLINPASKTYLVVKPGEAAGASAMTAAAVDPVEGGTTSQKALAEPAGGVVTYTTTLTDTGERKPMFGREARHITTVITREPGASACDKTSATVEVDAWYVDVAPLAHGRSGAASTPSPAAVPKADGCSDRVEMRTIGDAKLGFPLAMKTTTKSGDAGRQDVAVSSMEVIAFEVTTLDAGLFDLPAGYTEMKSNAELIASFKGGSGGLSEALAGSTADGTGAAAPKSAGAMRIGVLEPVDKSTHALPTRELRQELASDFDKAPYEALTLSGTSVADARSEAARMECDYLLYSEITDIKTSKPGRVGGLLKKVSRDGPARDVHEVKLDYRLYPVAGAATAPAFTESTKATSGGGFGLHSAIHLAMVAGALYMRFSGLSLLNPMLMSQFGGGAGPLASSGFFDPRMSAMSSISQLLRPGAGLEVLGDNGAGVLPGATAPAIDSELEIRQTVSTALANAAKGTIEQLKKNNRK